MTDGLPEDSRGIIQPTLSNDMRETPASVGVFLYPAVPAAPEPDNVTNENPAKTIATLCKSSNITFRYVPQRNFALLVGMRPFPQGLALCRFASRLITNEVRFYPVGTCVIASTGHYFVLIESVDVTHVLKKE